jgi:type II restriction enzyme
VKFHPTFSEKLGLSSPDEVFDFLKKTLKPRLAKPSYFVNWAKVQRETNRVEMALHQLDYILGKPDLEAALFDVIKANPSVVDALPSVFASREEHEFTLMPEIVGDYLNFTEHKLYSSNIKTDEDIKAVVAFCKTIGLLDFVKKAGISSFTDFVYGVETGLDSNGRKNRGGTQMEDISEYHIKTICTLRGFDYIKQASATAIQSKFNKRVTVDKSERLFDFAVNTPKGLYLIETNFYGSGGSKLKATAGEYAGLHTLVKGDGHEFIWVTDGRGWRTALLPLRAAFDRLDYILNLEMVNQGILEAILLS